MCHTCHQQQLEEQFLRKYFLVCPENESGLDPWWLVLKLSSKNFWQSVQKIRREVKIIGIVKLFALNASAIIIKKNKDISRRLF